MIPAHLVGPQTAAIAQARLKLPPSALDALDAGESLTIHQVMGRTGLIATPELRREIEGALAAAGYYEAPARRLFEPHTQMFWSLRPPMTTEGRRG